MRGSRDISLAPRPPTVIAAAHARVRRDKVCAKENSQFSGGRTTIIYGTVCSLSHG